MRHIILISLFLFPLWVLGQTIDIKTLEEKNGITYQIGKSKPYKGQAIEYFANGKKKTLVEYKAGIVNGKILSWYADGGKQVEGQLTDGLKTGVWSAWYENGKLLRQGAFVNGKEEGEFIWWFENGKIDKKGIYHNGTADGKWEWFYENGKKKQEGILKGEVSDGTWKDWYEDGTPKMVGTFVNGVKEGEWVWWDEKGVISDKKKYKAGTLLESSNELDKYIASVEKDLEQRDFKSAASTLEKALSNISDKSERNKVYMGLMVYQAKVYAMFQRLDEAETILLKLSGLPAADIEAIVKTNYPPAREELKALAGRIVKYPDDTSKIGAHLALALIYNVIGDTVKMAEEQQLMMERSNYSDWVIASSLDLYKIRGLKENHYGYIKQIKEEIAKTGITRENQLQLASNLSIVGRFKEAELIADKCLKENENDTDFMLIKANIEMAIGNVAKFKEYESRLKKLDPEKYKE